jgi:predicted nucleic acid-binding Zn ribbon protein
MIRNRSKPSAAGDILSSVFKYHRLEKKVKNYSIIPDWTQIVGQEIADVAIPEKIIAKKILVLRVKDAVWAQELALRKQEILETLYTYQTQKEEQGTIFEDLKFVTGNPKDFIKKNKK